MAGLWFHLVGVLAFEPAAVGVEAEPPEPLPIVGGDQAGVCQFPTVVSMLVGNGSAMICTGTLIHPQVVMTAAHCILPEAPIDAVGFGEKSPDVGVPALIVDTVECVPHPDYATNEAHDVAYCVLEQPVALDIVPLVAGCELGTIVPGQEIVIVGFGATYATDNENADGVGTKRYTTQTIHSVDVDQVGEVNFIGADNMHSACFGDSGGPAFVRMADSTWRVFGTGSHLFDSGMFPPPPDGDVCGVGAAYGHAGLVAGWLEQQTGFDLTPCHDAMGTFTGGPTCGSFPEEPHRVHGTWANGCTGGMLGGGVEVCDPFVGAFDPDPGPPPDPDPDPTTTGPTTDPTTESTSDPTGIDTSGPPPDPTTVATTDPIPPPNPDPTVATSIGEGATDSSSSDGSTTGGAGEDELIGRGCGCTTDRGAPPFALFTLAWLGVWRRRTR